MVARLAKLDLEAGHFEAQEWEILVGICAWRLYGQNLASCWYVLPGFFAFQELIPNCFWGLGAHNGAQIVQFKTQKGG